MKTNNFIISLEVIFESLVIAYAYCAITGNNVPSGFLLSIPEPLFGFCPVRLEVFLSIVISSNIYEKATGENLSAWRCDVQFQSRHFSAGHDYKYKE